MPQPLSKVCENASIIFGNAGDRPLLRHPQLGALAMEAIASYSNVENFMLHLFVVLLGGNNALAMGIYLALDTKGPKDFEDIIKANDRLCGFGQMFRFILENHVANRGDELYDQLCKEPEIQEKLKNPV